MKVYFSDVACSDIKSIFEYCLERFGEKTANLVEQQIGETAHMLENHPRLGKVEALLNDTGIEYRSIAVGQNKLVYSVHADYVFIHFVWNVLQDPDKLKFLLSRQWHDTDTLLDFDP